MDQKMGKFFLRNVMYLTISIDRHSLEAGLLSSTLDMTAGRPYLACVKQT